MNSQRSEENRPNIKMDGPLVPDGGWGWVVCFATFVCNILAAGINTSAGIFFVEMLHTFQESVTKTSVVVAVMNGLCMMISPLVSGVLPFFSHRQIIIAGSILGAITMFASAFATSINIMIVTFGIGGGISLGMIFFASNVIVSLYFNKRRGLAVGMANAGSGIGTFVMNYGIEKLSRLYALRGMLILLSGFVLNLAVFGALCRPLKYRRLSQKEHEALVCEQNKETDLYRTVTAEQNDTEKEDMLKTTLAKSDTEQDKSSDKNGRCKTFCKLICNNWNLSLLKNYNTLMLIIIFFLWAANQIVLLYLPFYAINVGLSLTDGVILMSILGIGITVGELLTGFLIDILHIKSDHLMTFSLIVLSATSIAFPLLSDMYSLAFLTAIWSIAVGAGVSLRVLLIVELLGIEYLAPVYSFVMFSNGLGYGIQPILFGLLYDLTKSFLVIFNLTAGFFCISLIFSFIINYRLRKNVSKNTAYPMNEDKEIICED